MKNRVLLGFLFYIAAIVLVGCCEDYKQPKLTHIQQLAGTEEYPYVYQLRVTKSHCGGGHTGLGDMMPIFLNRPKIQEYKIKLFFKKNVGRISPKEVSLEVEDYYVVVPGEALVAFRDIAGTFEFYNNKLLVNLRTTYLPEMKVHVVDKWLMIGDIVSRGEILLSDKVVIFSDEQKKNEIYKGDLESIMKGKNLLKLYMDNRVTESRLFGSLGSRKLGKKIDIQVLNPSPSINGVFTLGGEV